LIVGSCRSSLRAAINRILSHGALGIVTGVLTGAVAALGVAKALFEILSGDAIGLQELAYYLGDAAFFVYGLAVFLCFIMLPTLITALRVKDKRSRILVVVLTVNLIVALVLTPSAAWYEATEENRFDYDGASNFEKASVAIAGTAAVGAGIYLARRLRRHRE
jgi:hypothetical protein